MLHAVGMERHFLAAHEGYYGAPLTHLARIDLIRWLGEHDYDAFAYGPKDDPFHRERWREPYPPESIGEFALLQRTCADAGLELVLVMSPGLDWRAGDSSDVDALAAKFRAFYDIGVRTFSVNWDDVPGEGAEIGAEHGRAVAAVSRRFGDDVRWLSCPVDYALAEPSEYLRAFAAALPADAGILWTGPAVVTPHLDEQRTAAFVDAVDRPVYFGENYPVNDVFMSEVLHIGPYPQRDVGAADRVRGVFVNFMEHPLASRIGLACAARFWRDPTADREAAWRDVTGEIDGLRPLALACWSWVASPSPHPELLTFARTALEGDPRLGNFLRAGCREGLDPALAAEVEPWLAQWDLEAAAMLAALKMLDNWSAHGKPPSLATAWKVGRTWQQARAGNAQVFGIRAALYPVTSREDDRMVADLGSIVAGDNLTDYVVRGALARVGCSPVGFDAVNV